MKDTTAALMARYLENENVKYLFGVPGAHVLPIYDWVKRKIFITLLSCFFEKDIIYEKPCYAEKIK